MRLFIFSTDKKYEPVVLSGVKWATERKGSPSKVTFQCVADDALVINNGDIVVLTEGEVKFFQGYIFTYKYDEGGILSVTAYDQLRYFKNKDTRSYNLPAEELLKAIGRDYKLQIGECSTTGYAVSRIEEDAELFDIMQNCLSDTVEATGQLYVFYDDAGYLRLRNISEMRINVLLRPTSAEGYTYTSDIDKETYNQIRLLYEDKDSGQKTAYVVNDSSTIAKWGLLQMSESINTSDGAMAYAEKLLRYYNTPVRTLQVKNVAGDIRVRAGTSIAVPEKVDGKESYHYMLVESATHKFEGGYHLMDLTLKGGDVNG